MRTSGRAVTIIMRWLARPSRRVIRWYKTNYITTTAATTLHTTALPVPAALQQHERIALVFMGQPRLARDLLQVPLLIQFVLLVEVNESVRGV
jgi:hypothetical protein